ncbi:hypothetical protein [Streptomyces tailanensis]|uniref:hypothetical protein n=1 Tax=Streptomyces tailanensis TaxID=2569858 RepID=UPI00122E1E23|nr:hypothetical protein [Streptomyces tailanensis]
MDIYGDPVGKLGVLEVSAGDYSLAGVAATSGRDRWVKEAPEGATWAIRSNGYAPSVELEDDSEQARLIDRVSASGRA